MLDDLKYIHQIDKADALDIALKEPEQLHYVFDTKLSYKGVKNIVYTGMGGSALAAALSYSWPGFKVPFEIIRNYVLPTYVNQDTLLIVSSASGNTEETISALDQGESRGAKVVIMTGGGKLTEVAQTKGYPLFTLPSARQPRYGVFYNLKALTSTLEQLGLAADEDVEKLNRAAEFLKRCAKSWEAVVPNNKNLAKQIALDCLGKSVVIYGGPLLAPAAYKWKISFNENAKQIAWMDSYPEFNHNEFIGWSSQPVDKPYAVIDLRSTYEHPRVQKRFSLTAQLLSGRRPEPIVVNAEGENLLEHLLYSVLLGDFVSIYAAIAAGTNPEPVDLVEKFKVMMVGNDQSSAA
ncbi:bifunctional phosphoglucose/phosphomannose isomerase [Patescibacteria group bacterium]|nr:bifunctional phosphoglucose/phosphomannose isomerase [Patescibacteria group bacterium]